MQDTPLALHPPNPNISVRPVRLADMTGLRQWCWPDRSYDQVYRFISFATQLTKAGRGQGFTVLAPDQQTPYGYGQVTGWRTWAEISDLIITEGQRSKGLGTALIQTLVQYARKKMQAEGVEIGAALSNPGAVALYQRLGFQRSYTKMMDVGNGAETVVYLRLSFSGKAAPVDDF